MPIDPVSAGYTPTPTSAAAAAPAASGLKKDDFLQLLVTSLRYQDPSEPLSTSELMAQTTQLSTMEQLTELTTLTQEAFHLQMRSSATELVGKDVSYLDADGVRHSGVVSAVDFSVTPPGAVIGDAVVPMNLLATVGALPSATPPAGGAPTDPAA
ncbi:flagellar hook capping FlgD N-terminal domain-containing protein [Georgenia satyanarayanai]|uniref:flagellar hook capping FlgD N-terminal domain-containing protein n=1 Tax=Georgenia satyanarayanai TaxID=860221 RepID=UPI0012646A78|nr:flagellar hook capping FlgD N-terminal domain-containing protein [Georgenia satyanarayanai]